MDQAGQGEGTCAPAEAWPKGPGSPQPSEGQQRQQLRINWRLRLLGLALREEIIQEPPKPEEPPAPAFFAEEEQQAIAAGSEVQPAGGVDVGEGHGGRSAGRHFQAGRRQGPAPFA